MSSRAWMIAILVALLVVGIGFSMAEAYLAPNGSRSWWQALLNLGPELIGAVVTYALFEVFIASRAKTEEEKARLIEEAEEEKERLVQEMGSSVHDVAVPAAEKLAERGWLFDGSLRKVSLSGADLKRAFLWRADLQDANLFDVNLRGATLSDAKLQRAVLTLVDLQEAVLDNIKLQKADLDGIGLRGADLTNADLRGARIGGCDMMGTKLTGADLRGANITLTNLQDATLPDGSKGVGRADMARFTHPEHPDFWRSDDPESPAYRGSQG